MNTRLALRKNPQKNKLRKQLRAQRRELSQSEQKQAASQLEKRLRSSLVFLRSKHIAFYGAGDGEVSLDGLISVAQSMGKKCYLPILHPLKSGHLLFGRYRADDNLQQNNFGLAEPYLDKKTFPVWALDLVIMPLVGFDRTGNRLGMGGGFYDRTFGASHHRPKRPMLIGAAHHCQEVDLLSSENWDVKMDAVVTDKEFISF